MSANFLDTSGGCMGMDAHSFVIAVGPAPVTVPMVPHVVFAQHAGMSRDWRIAKKVTTNGKRVLQGNWAMLLLSHYPIPPGVPHPLEGLNLAAIVLTGSSSPQLTANRVTAEGGPLLVEIDGCMGLNLDCTDFPGICQDTNLNTVMTNPTLGDYVAALLSAALSWLYAWGGSKLGGLGAAKGSAEILKESRRAEGEVIGATIASVALAIAQTLADAVNSISSNNGDPVANAIGQIATLVQGLVDGAVA